MMEESLHTAEIIGFKIHDDLKGFDVIHRKSSNTIFMSNPPKEVPPRIFKNVFRVDTSGCLEFVRTLDAKVIPKRTIEETYIFEGENGSQG
jgi:hypothetical protein